MHLKFVSYRSGGCTHAGIRGGGCTHAGIRGGDCTHAGIRGGDCTHAGIRGGSRGGDLYPPKTYETTLFTMIFLQFRK